MVFRRSKQTRIAQPSREAGAVVGNRIGFELENAATVVHDVQLAGVVLAETDDLHRAVGQFAMPGHLFAIVAEAPDFSGHPVAIKVSAAEFAQPLAAIDTAASDGGRFRVGMINDRTRNRRRPWLAV